MRFCSDEDEAILRSCLPDLNSAVAMPFYERQRLLRDVFSRVSVVLKHMDQLKHPAVLENRPLNHIRSEADTSTQE